jgi:hypothetical protein
LFALAAGVGDLLGRRWLAGALDITEQGTQVQLIRVIEQAFLGLTAEQLALEPVELLLQRITFFAELRIVRADFCMLLRINSLLRQAKLGEGGSHVDG